MHQVAKYWSFSFSLPNEYLGLISFRIDWFHLLAKFFVYVHGRKEERKKGNSPCGLPIRVTDFHVYIRDKYFSVYVHGRQEGGHPRGLSIKDADFSVCATVLFCLVLSDSATPLPVA